MDLLAETRNLVISIQEDTLLSCIAVLDLKEILHLSTFISHGNMSNATCVHTRNVAAGNFNCLCFRGRTNEEGKI